MWQRLRLVLDAQALAERAHLAQRLVDHDRNRVGQVEAPHPGLEDWNPVGGAKPRGEELRRQAACLAAKDQEVAAAVSSLEI